MINKIKSILKKIIPAKFFFFYHFLWSFLSALFYRFPGKKIPHIIGITGTKGKTTTAELIYSLCQDEDEKVALSSSLEFRIGKEIIPNNFKMTMPGRGFLQKFLAKAKKEKSQIVIIEVTSEGILQAREKFIDFDIKVFLNLSFEHLERHQGFSNYKKTKGKFFQGRNDNFHIINLDDQEAEYFLSFKARKIVGFSLFENNPLKDKVDIFLLAKDYQFSERGTRFVLVVNGQEEGEFCSPLTGEFNLYNTLAAIAVTLALGKEKEKIKEKLKNLSPPVGRFEIIKKNHFQIIIDYAHTPDSLKAALKTIKEILKPDYLVSLTGAAGGGRDKWKRKEIGRIASLFSDSVILTNEDPYDEDPKEIIEEIYQGIPLAKREKVEKILDRKEAIKRGLELIKKKPGKNIFAIFGKGGERWLCLKNDKKIPWSDKKIVLSLLTNKMYYPINSITK